MKRILFVLALMLVLSVCFVGEAFALNFPYGDIRNEPDGDDHPWGGGDHVGPTPPPITKYDNLGSFTSTTGIVPIDIVLHYLVIDKVNSMIKEEYQQKIRSSKRYEFRKYSTVKSEGIRK